MTIAQKKKIMKKIVALEQDIEALKKARMEVATSGYSSATLSTTGGSKSFTRIDIDKISNLINDLLRELTQWRNLLVTGDTRHINTTVTIYI